MQPGAGANTGAQRVRTVVLADSTNVLAKPKAEEGDVGGMPPIWAFVVVAVFVTILVLCFRHTRKGKARAKKMSAGAASPSGKSSVTASVPATAVETAAI